MEFYLTHPNFYSRQHLTKFRISDHKLLIETGRYFKIPWSQRLCENCKNIDDELHFFTCQINPTPRKILNKEFNKFYQNFTNLPNKEKHIKCLNPSTPNQIKGVLSFIEKSLELRKGDP